MENMDYSYSYRKRSDYHHSISADLDYDYTPDPEESPKVKHSAPAFLMELFRVKIDCQDNHDINYISGTVSIHFQDPLEIYKQIKLPIRKGGGDLLLTGPSNFILAFHSTTIYMNLMMHSISPEHLISSEHFDDIVHKKFCLQSGCYTGNPADIPRADKPLRDVFNGFCRRFTATFFYAIFSRAVQAIVEVTLIDVGNPVVGLYGLLAASNNMFPEKGAASNDMFPDKVDYDDYESVLFLKEPYEFVKVRSGDSILLSRSSVAVPLDSKLIIRAVLHNQESMNEYFPPTKIYFPAKRNGVSKKSIDGKIMVTVTWNTSFLGVR